MKYSHFYFLSLLFLGSSCDNQEEAILIFKYALETNTTEKYVLNIKKNDSILGFQYRNIKDTSGMYDLTYIADREQLKLKSKIFLTTEENYSIDGVQFKIFQRKEKKTGIRTLVFSQNYGLLASVGFGENFIFSKDSLAPKIKEITFKKIFRSINSLRVQ